MSSSPEANLRKFLELLAGYAVEHSPVIPDDVVRIYRPKTSAVEDMDGWMGGCLRVNED